MELYMGLAASPQIQVGPGCTLRVVLSGKACSPPTHAACPGLASPPVLAAADRPPSILMPAHRPGLSLPAPQTPHPPPTPYPPTPTPQWVYFEEETPVAVLEEVQAQLLGAYEFIQDREAEAPAQYRAVQVGPGRGGRTRWAMRGLVALGHLAGGPAMRGATQLALPGSSSPRGADR